MGKFFAAAFTSIREFFDRYFIVITLLTGVFCLYYGLRTDNANLDIKKLLHTIGSLSLASGIFAGIAKSNQFTEIYRKVFREIIYGNEHLENRKDLEKIWENVTQVLSNQKFQKISDLMRANIKKYFLPLDHDYYYDDVNVDINIEFDPTNLDYLIIKETVSYTIICDDEDLVIDNRFSVAIKADMANRELTQYKLVKLTIDNEIKKSENIEQKYEGNLFVSTYENKLKGRKSYQIKREEEKRMNLIYNPIRKQLAVWIYNNFKYSVIYPKDIIIDFNDMGVLGAFTKENISNGNFNRIKAEYKGLIYKNQGFFTHLRKK